MREQGHLEYRDVGLPSTNKGAEIGSLHRREKAFTLATKMHRILPRLFLYPRNARPHGSLGTYFLPWCSCADWSVMGKHRW